MPLAAHPLAPDAHRAGPTRMPSLMVLRRACPHRSMCTAWRPRARPRRRTCGCECSSMPAYALGVSVATNGTLYQTEVFAASHAPFAALPSYSAASAKQWGDRSVTLLAGDPARAHLLREDVWPRLSSSHYIVGVQGDALLSLDPHHSRPAAPLRLFVGELPSA
ncbi:hypothetical protein B0H14DRAFT_2746959 [Mycena olivaceomarginata]|nr:hypothetical protein B0H14DRAFT_2746959 [Mycena olivaceomarginata]